MEIVTKREMSNGIVKLPANVTPLYSEIETPILQDVEPDDLEYMALVVDYCATTIGKKHEDVKVFVFAAHHEQTKEVLLYTLYVGLPMTTVVKDSHFQSIRQISYRRITQDIQQAYDAKAHLWRLEFFVHPMRRMPKVQDITVTNIHMKQAYVNLITEGNDDDKRGSTKRTRRDAEIDK